MELSKILELVDESPDYHFVKKTLRIIRHAFKLYDLNTLFVSYNGGKDAEVALQLVRLALFQEYCKKEENETSENFLKYWKQIRVVYFEEANPIPEVDQFVIEQSKLFNFELIKMEKDVKKESFALAEKYNMKAIFLGTRRADPYSAEIEFYSPSDMDKGWATFMRIHPIIDWNYEQIWKFLRDFKMPYCYLYDKGYTHLGNINNSGPNDFLLQPNGEYLPAYKADGKYEHYSRKCYEASRKYLDTKHFVIVYKTTMTDILDTIKNITSLFGNCPHISIIELETVNEFLKAISTHCKCPKSKDVTIVFDNLKLSKDEIEKKVQNLDAFQLFEVGKHH